MSLIDTPALALGAVAATVAVLWTHVGALARTVRRLFVMDFTFPNSATGDYILTVAYEQLTKKGRVLWCAEPSACHYSVIFHRRAMLYVNALLGKPVDRATLAWYKRGPVFWVRAAATTSSNSSGVAQAANSPVHDSAVVRIYWLRGFFDIEAYLHAVGAAHADHALNMTHTSFSVNYRRGRRESKEAEAKPQLTVATTGQAAAQFLRNTVYGYPDKSMLSDYGHSGDASVATLERLQIPEAAVAFAARARRWYRSVSQYNDRGVPWRLSACLAGPPGTGKTSYAVALGRSLGLPVEVFDIPTMSDHDFVDAWRQVTGGSPVIILFDDFDRVFDEDKATSDSTLSARRCAFSTVLGVIGGALPAQGVLLLVAVNDPKKLDAAMGVHVARADGVVLSSRPGRLDYIIDFPGTLDVHARRRIAERILRGCGQELIDRAVTCTEGMTPAQVEFITVETYLKFTNEQETSG